MKSIKKSRKLLHYTLLFWFLETWYFGFNLTAQSTSEKVCDLIVGLALGIAIYWYFKPLNLMYLEKVKDMDKVNDLINEIPEHPEQGKENL